MIGTAEISDRARTSPRRPHHVYESELLPRSAGIERLEKVDAYWPANPFTQPQQIGLRDNVDVKSRRPTAARFLIVRSHMQPQRHSGYSLFWLLER